MLKVYLNASHDKSDYGSKNPSVIWPKKQSKVKYCKRHIMSKFSLHLILIKISLGEAVYFDIKQFIQMLLKRLHMSHLK